MKTIDPWQYEHIVFLLAQVCLQKAAFQPTGAIAAIRCCDLFVSIGTSGVVYPAAGFPRFAKENNALCIEINPEANEMLFLYDEAIRDMAGKALPELFG